MMNNKIITDIKTNLKNIDLKIRTHRITKHVFQLEHKISKLVSKLPITTSLKFPISYYLQKLNNTIKTKDYHGMQFNFAKYNDVISYLCTLTKFQK